MFIIKVIQHQLPLTSTQGYAVAQHIGIMRTDMLESRVYCPDNGLIFKCASGENLIQRLQK